MCCMLLAQQLSAYLQLHDQPLVEQRSFIEEFEKGCCCLGHDRGSISTTLRQAQHQRVRPTSAPGQSKVQAISNQNCTAAQALLLLRMRCVFTRCCTANYCTGRPGAVSASLQVACTSCCCGPSASLLTGQHSVLSTSCPGISSAALPVSQSTLRYQSQCFVPTAAYNWCWPCHLLRLLFCLPDTHPELLNGQVEDCAPQLTLHVICSCKCCIQE